MILKSIEIENFLGIGKAVLHFDKTGLILVEGINHDSPSAASNGAGKSSIAEALFWVLFGKTRRGLTGDDVINEQAGKDCKVTLNFDNFEVSRYRKWKKESNTGLTLWEETEKDEMKELTKGTTKDTQALLEEIIKMSELTFNKVAYFGQSDVKAFASLGDAELKQIFEQALGLSFFGQYLDKAKKYKSELEGKIMKAETEQNDLLKEQDFIREKIALIKRQTDELVQTRKLENGRLQANLKQIQEEIGERRAAITHISDEDYSEKLVALNESRIKLGNFYKLKTELDEKYQDESKALMKIKIQNEQKEGEIKRRLRELEKLKEKIGTECGECKKKIEEIDIADISQQIKIKVTEIQNDLDGSSAELDKVQESVDGLRTLSSKLSEKIEGLRGAESEIRVIDEKIKSAVRIKKQEEDYLAKLQGQQKSITMLICSLIKLIESPDTISTEVEEENLKAKKSAIEKCIRQLTELREEIEGAQMLVEIVGNGGLKSYIFDSVTPELNRIVNEYMNILNPDIGVEISTVSKLKSGDFKEKFGINITNTNGAGSYDGSSGGERQLINLAIALGFNTICRAMSEGSVNTLFLDEPLESLDESNAERAIELCQKFVAKIPNVFLVSHNPSVKDLVADKITIVKVGGRATLAA